MRSASRPRAACSFKSLQSEQVELAGMLAGLFFCRYRQRTAELRGVEPAKTVRPLHAVTRHRLLEALADQVGPDALALHARGEVGVVVLAAAHVLDAVHHAPRTVREMRFQPFAEQRADFPWQAQHD